MRLQVVIATLPERCGGRSLRDCDWSTWGASCTLSASSATDKVLQSGRKMERAEGVTVAGDLLQALFNFSLWRNAQLTSTANTNCCRCVTLRPAGAPTHSGRHCMICFLSFYSLYSFLPLYPPPFAHSYLLHDIPPRTAQRHRQVYCIDSLFFTETATQHTDIRETTHNS